MSTPVWLVRYGAGLAVWTGAETAKVKRIRANPMVTVAPCGIRGKLRGTPVPARARRLPPDESALVRQLIRRKYGLQGWLMTRRAERVPESTIGILITLG